MATTKIEWADKVWNPITGCTPVSAGCKNCYAKRMANRLRGRCGYPAENPFAVTLHIEKTYEPLKWKKPQRIFVSSMGDWMHEDVPVDYIDQILEVIDACPQHTFLTLTKRPENLQEKLWGVTKENPFRFLGGGDYLKNLWIGVSIEDQPSADKRLRELFQVEKSMTGREHGLAAMKKFVSYEPAIGEVDFSAYLPRIMSPIGLDLIIMGGESGPGARPMNPDWARKTRDDCKAAGVPFFLKHVSKKDGCLLDGKEHKETPR